EEPGARPASTGAEVSRPCRLDFRAVSPETAVLPATCRRVFRPTGSLGVGTRAKSLNKRALFTRSEIRFASQRVPLYWFDAGSHALLSRFRKTRRRTRSQGRRIARAGGDRQRHRRRDFPDRGQGRPDAERSLRQSDAVAENAGGAPSATPAF